jgi:hypothetical protein
MGENGKIIPMENQSCHSGLSGHRQRTDFNLALTRKFGFVFGATVLSLILFLGKAGAANTKLINVDFGSGETQTGSAVLGNTHDTWNALAGTTSALVDSTGRPLDGMGLTLNSAGVYSSTDGSTMDFSTTPLMEDYAYAQNAPVSVSLTGLNKYMGCAFTLVVYASGNAKGQGNTLNLTACATGGNSASTLTTSGSSRQITAGSGVAYNTFTGILTNGVFTFLATPGPGQTYAVVNGFQLQITTPDPWIDSQPASHKVLAGRTTSFNVITTGTPPFRYQWQAGSIGSEIYTNLIDDGNISGTTSDRLKISNVTTNQAMAYRVVVANESGSITSSPDATLTVVSEKNIFVDVQFIAAVGPRGGPGDNGLVSQPQTGAAILGSAGDLWNQISIGYYVDRDNNTPISGLLLTNVTQTASGLTLTVTEPNNAVYGERNDMGGGTDADTINLMNSDVEQYLVNGAGNDTWVISIGNLSVYTNSPFNLVVYAGAPNPQVQNISLVSGATGGNTGSKLATSSVSRQLSAGPGVAYVKFSGILTGDNLTFTINDPGTANSTVGSFLNGFQLEISDPIITEQPAAQRAFPGQDVQFSVGAVGTGTLKYQWQASPADGPYTNLIDGDQITGAQGRVLKITNVTTNWAGDYQVIVSNGSGSVTSTPPATLTVLPGNLIPLVNANFNADTISGPNAPTNQTATPTGWTWNGSGTVGLLNPNYSYSSPIPNVLPAGAVFTASPDGIVNPGISQILPTTLNSNTTYTLSAQVGNRNSGVWGGYHIALETTNGTVVGDWTGENNNIAAPGTFATTSRSFTTGPNPPGVGQLLEIVLEQAAPAKNSYSDFASLLLATMPATPHAQGTPIDVYVCAGQSNAHGWQANPANLSRDNLHYVNAPDARALFAYQANLVTQKNFYSQGSVGQLSTEGAGYAGNFSGFGPELSAGSDLAERFSKPLAIVKFASGGADLDTQFAKSANFLYPRLIAEVTNSLAQLIAQGYTPNLKGFFWLQGESDALLNPSTYATDIGQFVSDVRTDLKVPTLQFVLTEINTNLPAFALSQAGVAQVNQAMANLTKTDANVKFVTTADINDGFADTVHYTADQIIKIGQRWAAAFTVEPNPHGSPP